MKWGRTVGALALIAVIGVAGYAYSRTYTPYGRLNYPVALSLVLTTTYKLKPDPNNDLSFRIPLNAFFAIDQILPKEKVAKTEDIIIPSDGVNVPARVYWPEGQTADETLPVFVYFHGGGHVVGSVNIFDALARSLTNASKAVLISVDYRLAPANPYPAAVNDCYTAVLWAAKNAASLGGDASKLIVGGDSAGGNLAAVVALKARDEHGTPIAAQILFYFVTDLTDRHYDSVDRFSDGYGLSAEQIAGFRSAYVGHVADKRDPSISPLYAPSLAHLPPSLIFTGGFDRLTDGTKAYIERLKADGVPVTWRHFPGSIHGFMSVRLFGERREALNETARFLRDVPRSAPLTEQQSAPGRADETPHQP